MKESWLALGIDTRMHRDLSDMITNWTDITINIDGWASRLILRRLKQGDFALRKDAACGLSADCRAAHDHSASSPQKIFLDRL